MAADLWAVCQCEYFPRRLKIRSGETKRQYRIAIRSFELCLGRPATLADLNDDTVTVWLSGLLDEDSGLSLYTVKERLGRVLSLWRWCAARRIVDRWPTVQAPEPPEIVPVALREHEALRLWKSLQRERGTIDGIPAGLWWTSHCGFILCTSERKSAALAVRLSWIDLAFKVCSIPAAERKGRRKPAIYHLPDELIPLLQAILAVSPNREFVWPWPLSEDSYYHHWGRILLDAGLPNDRKHKAHCLRVTHATWRQIAGGDSTRQLMHSDPGTTARHYIDRRQLPADETKIFIPWDRPQDDRWAS